MKRLLPAYFILVEDHNADDPSASTPSMILQVAAESDIPKPKIFSVSNQIPNTLNSETGGDTSSDNQSKSTAVTQCDQGNNSTNCDQCAGGCNSCGSDACGHGGCDECWPQCLHPTWIFKGGALVLDRVSPRSTALVVETGTGLSLMNASGFSFNWNGGVDASLIRRIGDDNLSGSALFRHQQLDGFSTVRHHHAGRDSHQSARADRSHRAPAAATAGAAERYLSVRHESVQRGSELAPPNRATRSAGWLASAGCKCTMRWASPSPNATVRSVTDNQLCGGQIGADLKMWEEGGPLRIDSVIKAGLYNNNASDLLESRSQLAFVGEIGVNIIYQCCDHVALSAGYELLWLDGLAVASDQIPHIDLTTLSGLTTSGNAFYHGAMFSVNCSW